MTFSLAKAIGAPLAALVLALWALAPLQPASAKEPPRIEQIALSADKIRSFFSSMQTMRAMTEELESTYGGKEKARPGKPGNPMSRFQHLMAAQGARFKLNAAVRKYGFADSAEWLRTGQSTMLAFIGVKMAGQMPQINEAMRQAVDQIKNNPDIPAAQKKELLKRFGGGQAPGYMGPQALPENVALIKTMMPEVEAAMQNMRRR